MQDIVGFELKAVAQGLLERGISLEVSEEAKEWVGDKGYDPFMGARPLRRVIQDHIEDKLSDAILDGQFSPGDTAIVSIEGDDITVTTQKAPVEEAAPA